MRIGHDNPKGLTLAELRQWIEKCETSEIPGQSRPRVRITLTGKIKRIETADGKGYQS